MDISQIDRSHSPRRRALAGGQTPPRRRALAHVIVSLALSPGVPGQSAGPSASPGSEPAADGARAGLEHQTLPQHTLAFVMNAHGLTRDQGALADGTPTVLGELFDTNIARVRPGPDAVARKWHATPEFCVLVGDPDLDSVFWQTHGDDLDALGVRRGPFAPQKTGAHTLRDVVLSTEDAWGNAQPQIVWDNGHALDGSLFSLDRDEHGLLDVQLFLPEALVLAALGQYGEDGEWDVDIDAFVQDHGGNVFLSFRHDEPIHGTWYADDSVVCLPADALHFDADGNIISLTPDCAVVVLDNGAVNALVQHAELLSPAGSAIHNLGDLQALALDPAGGTFQPLQPVSTLPAGVPHLLFNGQRLGPTVLSTRDGGRIATLNGQPLGAVPFDGRTLGLHASSSATTDDLNALLVLPTAPDLPLLDVEHGDVDLAAGEHPAFLFTNFTPGGVAWTLILGVFPVTGTELFAPAGPWPGAYPWLAVPAPWVSLAVPVDAVGRARLDAPIEFPPSAHLWVVVQAVDLASGQLSTPAAVWCPD
jgi:hypothetical protein